MLATASQLEVLDLRHFSGPALRPLLEDEAARWANQLSWDYSRSIELLLDYINNRSLTGYVACRQARVTGYSFGVCEAAKAVVGDLYAFGEGQQHRNLTCALLLDHLLETLQATPGIGRIESQLLLFPAGALAEVFGDHGFHAFPRCFMQCRLTPTQPGLQPSSPVEVPPPWRITPWQPDAYAAAAALIQSAYVGHMDADINDQYRSLSGAQRFLHNIVNFPGCGVFDPAHSWLLRHARTGALEGIVLCSRVRGDTAHITQLCIRETLRGSGLGTAMLRHCLATLIAGGLRTVSLTVTRANAAAVHLYEREGFAHLHNFDAWVWDKADR